MTNACHILGVFRAFWGGSGDCWEFGRDLGGGVLSYNLPLRCYFAYFAYFIALPRYLVPPQPPHFICVFGCMLCVDIIFASRCGAADGAAKKDLGAGETGRKKFFIYFFKKMRKSVAFYIFLWYYVSEEAYRRLLPSRQRTAEVGY